MRTAWIALGLLAVGLGCGGAPGDATPEPPTPDRCGVWAEPGRHEVTIAHGRDHTAVQVYVPEGRRADTLVVLLHGGDGSAKQILKQTGYRDIADRHGVVLAMPEGVLQPDSGKRKWSSGKKEHELARDDVAFLDALAARAGSEGCLSHTAAVGFSNGAQMAHRWGCEGTELDAVVAAAGGLLVPHEGCTGRRLPVLTYAGERDDALDHSPTEHRDLPSIRESIAWWRDHNGCDRSADSETVGRTTCESWSGEAPVRLCVTARMGHGFPTDRDGGVDGASDSWGWLQSVL